MYHTPQHSPLGGNSRTIAGLLGNDGEKNDRILRRLIAALRRKAVAEPDDTKRALVEDTLKKCEVQLDGIRRQEELSLPEPALGIPAIAENEVDLDIFAPPPAKRAKVQAQPVGLAPPIVTPSPPLPREYAAVAEDVRSRYSGPVLKAQCEAFGLQPFGSKLHIAQRIVSHQMNNNLSLGKIDSRILDWEKARLRKAILPASPAITTITATYDPVPEAPVTPPEQPSEPSRKRKRSETEVRDVRRLARRSFKARGPAASANQGSTQSRSEFSAVSPIDLLFTPAVLSQGENYVSDEYSEETGHYDPQTPPSPQLPEPTPAPFPSTFGATSLGPPHRVHPSEFAIEDSFQGNPFEHVAQLSASVAASNHSMPAPTHFPPFHNESSLLEGRYLLADSEAASDGYPIQSHTASTAEAFSDESLVFNLGLGGLGTNSRLAEPSSHGATNPLLENADSNFI